MNPYFATRFSFMCGLVAPIFMIIHTLTSQELTMGGLRASVVLWCALCAGWASCAFMFQLRLEKRAEDRDGE